MQNFDPLAQTEWLAEHLDEPGIRIVDIRGYVKKRDLGDGRQEAEYLAARDEYDEAHIPGAVYVDWTHDIIDPEDPVPVQLAPPDRFSALMGSLGIGDDTHVVAYDHAGGQFATRLWWALTYYGHARVSVLDGGWKKWTAEDCPTTAQVSVPEPAVFTPRPHPGRHAPSRGHTAGLAERHLPLGQGVGREVARSRGTRGQKRAHRRLLQRGRRGDGPTLRSAPARLQAPS
jgi:thiosulfate/3-mercaptopyruvate sulfurtransferase